jgi:tRNA dimethylallyltransferase
MRPVLLIHGPTASGKTELAIALARRLDGEVVNADSMQVYADLRVLTARPTEAEEADAPHHLFGHVDPARRYSTGQWLEDAARVLAGIERRGKVAIFVGGTGLYFSALIQGLSDIPPVPEDIREDVRELIRTQGIEALRERLARIDPESAARISPGDRQRNARAYEVWLATGEPLSAFQGVRARAVLADMPWLGIALTPPRPKLYARIDKRFEAMLAAGVLAEADAVLARELDPELPAMKAHGLPWIAAHRRGEITIETLTENATRDTRRYAKRQFTWISRQFPFWTRIPALETETRAKIILALYRDLDRQSR